MSVMRELYMEQQQQQEQEWAEQDAYRNYILVKSLAECAVKGISEEAMTALLWGCNVSTNEVSEFLKEQHNEMV